MGGKYEVRGCMSGLCPFWADQFTDSLFHALLLLVRYALKFRIVEFHIRKGALDCTECVDEDCPSRLRGHREWS